MNPAHCRCTVNIKDMISSDLIVRHSARESVTSVSQGGKHAWFNAEVRGWVCPFPKVEAISRFQVSVLGLLLVS